MIEQDFSGIWHSVYHYTSTTLPGLFDSEHDVKIHHKGDHLIIESLPNKEKSYIIMRLKLDDRVATGTWEEHSSPTGYYKGAVYTGAVQLVLTEDGKMFHGMYVAIDRRSEVRSGYWEVTRK
jgi:hypothetical protein